MNAKLFVQACLDCRIPSDIMMSLQGNAEAIAARHNELVAEQEQCAADAEAATGEEPQS